jgi:hypothetical protein
MATWLLHRSNVGKTLPARFARTGKHYDFSSIEGTLRSELIGATDDGVLSLRNESWTA